MTTHSCKKCRISFAVSVEDERFYERAAPRFNGNRYDFPHPTLCPPCRQQRRMAYRSSMYVTLRASSWTGAKIFSAYPADAPFPVIENNLWWGDSWDATDFGRDFDFSRPFFEQFAELRAQVPHRALTVKNNENSEYCNNAANLKGCYLVFSTAPAKDSLYCTSISHSSDLLDCSRTKYSELCYECTDCYYCYSLQNSVGCENCRDSFFLLNCRACHHCIACANLSHKEYCIFNKAYSKEEYFSRLEEMRLDSFSGRENARREAMRFHALQPRPHIATRMSENVSGNHINESKDIHHSFFVDRSEKLRYCYGLMDSVRDCMDTTSGGINAELLYEVSISALNLFNCCYCFELIESCRSMYYSALCSGCEHCFACVGLKKKRFCVLNKQYTEDEYQKIVPRIIEHMRSTSEWGEFFPLALAPYPYNLSLAQLYYPYDQQLVQDEGLKWYAEVSPGSSSILLPEELPDGLPDDDSSLTTRSVASSTVFRITTEEIRRYRKMGVPLPRKTFQERMTERERFLGTLNLYERICPQSGETLFSAYPSEFPGVTWSKAAYDREFFS